MATFSSKTKQAQPSLIWDIPSLTHFSAVGLHMLSYNHGTNHETDEYLYQSIVKILMVLDKKPVLITAPQSPSHFILTRASTVPRSLILLPLRFRYVRLGHLSARTSRPPEMTLSLNSSYCKKKKKELTIRFSALDSAASLLIVLPLRM